MILKKLASVLVALSFLISSLIWLPQASFAIPPGGHPVFGPNWTPVDDEEEEEATEVDEDEKEEEEDGDDEAKIKNKNKNKKGKKGQAWLRDSHPSLKGLMNALENAKNNGASPVAVAKLEQLINSRQSITVGDAAGELEETAGALPDEQSIYEALDAFYSSEEYDEIPVFIKGKKVKFDVAPKIVDGRTMVPLREFAESMDCTVDWDGDKNQVAFMKGNKKVLLVIGVPSANVNGEDVSLDVPAQIIKGRTLIPLRFVSEILDAKVEYYKASKLIVVN